MNHDSGSSVAEHGMVIAGQSDAGGGHGCVRGTIFTDDEGEVRNVSCRQAVVAVAPVSGAVWVEMRSRGGKIRRFALCCLMNMDGVLARWKILDVDLDLNAVWRFREYRRSDVLALRILDFNGDRLGAGMGWTILGERRAADGESQAHRKHDGFHLDPL